MFLDKGSCLRVIRENKLPLILLALYLYPPVFMEPIDWIYLQINGYQIVDYTYGFLAYILFIPASLIILSAATIRRFYSKAASLDSQLIHLACCAPLLYSTSIVLFGYELI